ncbi:hypothetical protein MKK75_32880 [Methylobacterium sp. J-030]|uniref:hypothetical protein n=1 Tax=Methylobacterium sp. J-030 TaxID=2836627 RepID=UPI001FB878CD|nr:hypothetical protein [Methylobacterium sp. J-030]MCJ2073528.1 hypothetical protein [Methylobacterium sp. J-030]
MLRVIEVQRRIFGDEGNPGGIRPARTRELAIGEISSITSVRRRAQVAATAIIIRDGSSSTGVAPRDRSALAAIGARDHQMVDTTP